jgi:hypothetical protein
MRIIAAAMFLNESLVGHNQPCQTVYAKLNLDTTLFMASLVAAFSMPIPPLTYFIYTRKQSSFIKELGLLGLFLALLYFKIYFYIVKRLKI